MDWKAQIVIMVTVAFRISILALRGQGECGCLGNLDWRSTDKFQWLLNDWRPRIVARHCVLRKGRALVTVETEVAVRLVQAPAFLVGADTGV